MSLRQVKTLYCSSAIVVALILVYIGGMLGWITAISLLAGSLPLFKAIQFRSEQRGVSDYRRLRQSTARRILATDQEELDAREVGR